MTTIHAIDAAAAIQGHLLVSGYRAMAADNVVTVRAATKSEALAAFDSVKAFAKTLGRRVKPSINRRRLSGRHFDGWVMGLAIVRNSSETDEMSAGSWRTAHKARNAMA
jgi:hypothetical protein